MRLGLSSSLKHSSPEEWAENMVRIGCGSVVFPLDYLQEEQAIKAYVEAAKKHELVIAEVGAWCNPISPNKESSRQAMEYCIGQLKLADRIGAKCCVNVTGSAGEIWDGAYKENLSDETWKRAVKSIQEIIDAANPKHTYYTIESMPWMHPLGPDEYLKMIEEVDREQFAVHLDIVNWITSPKKYFDNKGFIQECFDKLGSKVKSCHLKDIKLLGEYTFQLKECKCGEGILDIETYAQLADKVSRDMPLIIEHLDTDEAYLSSLEYVKQRLGI